MKKRNKGKGSLTPKVKKAFMLTTIINAVIADHHNGDPKLTTLRRQATAAMRVFSVKAGSRMYYELTDRVQDIWVKIDKAHTTPMLMDEVPVAVEMLFNLLPYKDMKTFLGVGYKTNNKV